MVSMGEKSVTKRLGEAIRAERIKRTISQENLAFASGLHRTYIGSVERGERNISLVNIVVIANALGLSASELLKKSSL